MSGFIIEFTHADNAFTEINGKLLRHWKPESTDYDFQGTLDLFERYYPKQTQELLDSRIIRRK